MAVESNGSLKGVNGSSHVNGKINGKINGQTPGRKRLPRPRRSFVGLAFNIVARLTTWAAILTIIFRCPASLEACDDTSPFVCQYYFQAKNTVSPYTQPYYEQFVDPYVELVSPYYETLDSHVLAPTRGYVVKHAAPWAKKGQEYVLSQWDAKVQPQVTSVREFSQRQYDQSVAPYLTQASISFAPYYEISRTNVLQIFYEFLLPSYEFVQPYAIQGYHTASDFATSTALPATHWAWNKTNAFLDKAVWPQVRALYMENVEPQLVRIGERLGRYKNKAKAKAKSKANASRETSASPSGKTAASESSPSSFSKPAPQSTQASVSTQVEQTTSIEVVASSATSGSSWNPVAPPPAAENESDQRKKAREMVTNDLEMWQNKFAAQAEEGASDMEDRIDEIARRMMEENCQTTGKSLVQKLELTVKAELENLKPTISSIIANKPDLSVENLEHEVVGAIRAAGMTIKSKAQEIRKWRESYDNELQDIVVSAADVHFQILDETRSLALQQIGMRWAWTDGVTYKDWAKYHELKKTLIQWTEELKELIVTHPTLLEAQDASAQMEDEGMTAASAAARELARLKQVSHWKVLAKDATENFELEALKIAAEELKKATEAAQHAAEIKSVLIDEAQEATNAISEEATAAASVASETMEEVVSSASSFATAMEVPASEGLSSASKAMKEATSTAIVIPHFATVVESELSLVSEKVEQKLSSTIESPLSTISEGIKGVVSSASSVVLEPLHTEATSQSFGNQPEQPELATVIFNEALDGISEVSFEPVSVATTPEVVEELKVAEPILDEDKKTSPVDPLDASFEDVFSQGGDDDEDADEESRPHLTEAMSTVKASFLGAAAQAVPQRQPILDDDTDTDLISGATNAAEAAYSSAVSLASGQYSSALSVVSAQLYGTPKPVHDQLFASVSTAYENAMAAASSKLNHAVDAASSGVFGAQTTASATGTAAMGSWARVESIAAERLNEGKLWAEIQYQSAMIAMGIATPTPTSPAEKYYQQAKYNYYAGLGLAQDRYTSFLAAASSAWATATATPTPTNLAGSASSLASEAGKSAASVAHAASEVAESAYSVATENVKSAAEAVDDAIASVSDAATGQIYSAGLAIGEAWDNAVNELSAQIYGQPTPTLIEWYDGLSGEASSYVATATNAAVTAAQTASVEAAKQYGAVSELISELIMGREAPFTQSVLSRLSAAYATAVENAGSMSSKASVAAASVSDKVSSAMSQATEAVKDGVPRVRDEL